MFGHLEKSGEALQTQRTWNKPHNLLTTESFHHRVLRSLLYLVGAVHEVHRDAEGQRVVVGVPQQDGHDLHAGRFGKTLSALQRPLYRALAVDSVLSHLAPVFRARARSDTYSFSS